MGSSSDGSVDASVITSRWSPSYPRISMSHGDDRCALLEPAWTTNALEQSRTGRHAAVVGLNDGERGDDHHAERLALRHTSCMVRRRFLVVASIALVVTGALGIFAGSCSFARARGDARRDFWGATSDELGAGLAQHSTTSRCRGRALRQ